MEIAAAIVSQRQYHWV